MKRLSLLLLVWAGLTVSFAQSPVPVTRPARLFPAEQHVVMIISWMVSGPGVRAGFDLTQIDKLQIDTEDTRAAVCWLLGLAFPAYFYGKPIREVFASPAVAAATP